jgi:hypothetical protein
VGVGGGGGSINIAAGTMLGNAEEAAADAVGLTPSEVRGLIEAVYQGDYDTDKGALDAHVQAGSLSTVTHAGTSVVGSPTVTFATPLPATVDTLQPITGPGIPDYSFVGAIAADRLSLTVSPSVIGGGTVNAVPGAGAGTFSFRLKFQVAHGLNVRETWAPHSITGTISGFSTPLADPTAALSAMQWEARWNKGAFKLRSREQDIVKGSADWQQMFPLLDYIPIKSHVLVAVPSAFQTWAFPNPGPTELFGSTRYRLVLPLEGSTQARIVIDYLDAGATAGANAKLKAQYLAADGVTWTDLAENSPASTIEATLLTGAATKGQVVGPWGVIDNAAITLAAAQGDTLLLRLVGTATAAAGTPSFGSIRIQTR